jgi:hypothetical protein
MRQETSPQRQVVVVLGFHRSGTSMVTRMLNLLGVDLGDEAGLLAPEERDNARGYWEPRWMIELNEELLRTVGSGTFEPFHPAPGWERAPELEPLRERARSLLREHFSDAPVWGWKDPRTSLTLPFWRQLIDAPVRFVVCVRSPSDAVASALKRGILDLHRWSYAERWLDYTSLALANTSADERLLLFYEDALREPARETRRLAAFLGIDEPGAEQLEASVASVDPELRHHTTNALDVAVDEGLPVEVRALYLLLRARRELEALREPTVAQARLLDALERVGGELRAARMQLTELHRSDLAARERVTALEAELAQVRDRAAAAQAAADEHAELHARSEQSNAQLRAQAEQSNAELTDLLAATAQRQAASDALVGERDAAIVALEREVQDLRGVLVERDAALATYAGSLSWKVTRPLRALAARSRRRG